MDKILLVDFLNQVYRASVKFGGVKVHQPCMAYGQTLCQHKLGEANTKHCVCAAKWDISDDRCYGDKYQLIYNFFRNLRPLIEMFSPDKCFFCLEGRAQFRYDLYPQYKANRIIKLAAKSPEENDKFLAAKDQILQLLQYLPITIARSVHYEADDLIGSLVEQLKDEEITVITNDSDFIQLLQKGYKQLTIYNPIKKEAMVAPTYFYIAGKSILGDKSDNIPALLTSKKAMKVINEPRLFQEFLANEGQRSLFNINKELIAFRMVPEDQIILQEGQANFPALKAEFERMDFQSIINEQSWIKYVETFSCLKY